MAHGSQPPLQHPRCALWVRARERAVGWFDTQAPLRPGPRARGELPCHGRERQRGRCRLKARGWWWTSDRHLCVKAWWYDGIKAAGRYYRYTGVREQPRQE